MVSIVIPIYNAEKHLTTCLEKIQNQSYHDWECILVDDGSSDKSGCICDEFSKRDSRFQVFHNSNSGVSAARNFGVLKSKGTWVAFVDADDYIQPDFIQNLLSYSDTQPDVIVGGNTYFGDEEGYTIPFETLFVKSEDFKSKVFNEDEWTWQRIFLVVWGKLFKRDIIINNNLEFNTKMKRSEDTVFMLNYLTKANSMMLVQSSDYAYRYEPFSGILKAYYKYSFEQFKEQYLIYKNAMTYVEQCDIGNFSHQINKTKKKFFDIMLSCTQSKQEFVESVNKFLHFEKDATFLYNGIKNRVKYKIVLFAPAIGYYLFKKSR